jgi:archaellin
VSAIVITESDVTTLVAAVAAVLAAAASYLNRSKISTVQKGTDENASKIAEVHILVNNQLSQVMGKLDAAKAEIVDLREAATLTPPDGTPKA